MSIKWHELKGLIVELLSTVAFIALFLGITLLLAVVL
jgi:hypothetical protein